jgi:cytochrome c oxidase cbb3-type subunit III
MKNRRSKFSCMRLGYKSLSVIVAMCLPFAVFAEAADVKAKAAESNLFNPLLISLLALVLVLVFAIGILGSVLKSLVFVYRDKLRKERQSSVAGKALGLVLAFMLPFAGLTAAEADSVSMAQPAAPIIAGVPDQQTYVLFGVIVLELIITVFLVAFIKTMIKLIVAQPELAKSPEAAEALAKVKKIPFWDRFHKAVEIEKEEGILLDHDYDGIKELDNSLPPWWKYGFYLTILISGIYLWYYHAGGHGPSQLDEYAAEVKAGEEAKQEYLAKSAGNVDENTVKMGDASSIAAGQTIFQNSCAACHAKDGGGGVGPNLTDEYWIHGGSINDVFKSIKYGWVDKGMKSWKDDFSPKQIADIASYVRSLKGSQPLAPKPKQGDMYSEGTTAPAKDSTQTVATN